MSRRDPWLGPTSHPAPAPKGAPCAGRRAGIAQLGGVRELRHGASGSYRTGCFYSEAISGLPYENWILAGGVGREFGIAATGRLVTLLHETVHLVQDLSSGVAIESDIRLDESLGRLVNLLRGWRDRPAPALPLISLHPSLGPADTELVDAILACEGLAAWLPGEALHVQFGDAGDSSRELSGIVLMEGLAAAAAARAVRDRCRIEDDVDYLADVADQIGALPQQLGEPYSSALDVFDAIIGPLPAAENSAWPRDADSPSGLSDLGSTFLADMACHLPPAELMAQRVSSGLNSWEDFLPARRYTQALDAISRVGGFPDMPPGGGIDDLYRRIHQLVARACGWPSWDDTWRHWQRKLAEFKQLRGSAVDGFRGRLVAYRWQRPATFLLTDPLLLCWQHNIPVLHLTANGMKVLQGVAGQRRGVVHSFEQPLTAYGWLSMTPRPWRDLTPDATLSDVANAQIEVLPAFLQEVVSRTIGRSLQQAAIAERTFPCPYAEVGCDVAQPGCRALDWLGGLPEQGCAVRLWLTRNELEPERLTWRQAPQP